MSKPFTMVVLGAADPEYDALWTSSPDVAEVVRFEHAQPQGLRFGRRSLGLGADAFLAAVKAVVTRPRARFLAVNPWTGAALRLLGRRDIAVTGIYATEGSRSWRMLRRVLGDAPVVATVSIESEAWRAAGGRSAHVLYGTTFDYPERRPAAGPVRVFIGGSSDRDLALVERIAAEAARSATPILLTIAVGRAGETVTTESGSVVRRMGPVSQAEFGRALADSDVVFLPLKDGDRAAGHMVAVGALQSGVPVASTRSIGMTGYVDGEYVREIDRAAEVLPQLSAIAVEMRDRAADIRSYWRRTHSREVGAAAVLAALRGLEQRP